MLSLVDKVSIPTKDITKLSFKICHIIIVDCVFAA
jgi:hypothetical protein